MKANKPSEFAKLVFELVDAEFAKDRATVIRAALELISFAAVGVYQTGVERDCFIDACEDAHNKVLVESAKIKEFNSIISSKNDFIHTCDYFARRNPMFNWDLVMDHLLDGCEHTLGPEN
jgi:hypothetical protein